jgi:hypothetical protein
MITIQLTRAMDLGDVPLQMHFADQPDSLALTLSKIRMDKLPDDLFLPPDDFTKYDNAVAMIGELASRQRSVHGGHESGGEGSKGSPTEPTFGGRTRRQQ